jgi:16S rRNA (guanine527-N7)-methyltransferase
VEHERISELLNPFLRNSAFIEHPALNHSTAISTYLDLLLRWNARVNLTSVREPEEIVTRHFGESFFAAKHLLAGASDNLHVIDVGSGAGFPGLPIKIWAQNIRLTLIESNHKKATFLREVIRALKLDNADVYSGRAEAFPRERKDQGDIVTLRAVEHFDSALAAAISLVRPGGRIALLISEPQRKNALAFGPSVRWLDPIRIPQSERRILLIAMLNQESHEPV